MGSKCRISTLASSNGTESISATEAVASNADFRRSGYISKIVDGRGNNGIRHIRTVLGKKLGRVEAGGVQIRWSRGAVEQIGSDC